MDQPTLTDYAHLIITLFDKFVKTNPVVLKYQNLCTYQYREMILFFMMMQYRRIYRDIVKCCGSPIRGRRPSV
ncbi:MAG: hypothetical protein ACE5E7_14765, partial [Anaerolineae bacterium]